MTPAAVQGALFAEPAGARRDRPLTQRQQDLKRLGDACQSDDAGAIAAACSIIEARYLGATLTPAQRQIAEAVLGTTGKAELL